MSDLAPVVSRIPVPGRALWWLGGAVAAGVAIPVSIGAITALLAYYPVGSFLPRLFYLSSVGTMLVIGAIALMVLAVGIGYSILALNWRPLLLAIITAGAMVPGVYPGLAAHFYLRKVAFEALADRSSTLVEAIKQYERETGTPPTTIADLVPRYLAEVPHTGMSAYPKYEYARAPGMCMGDNAWNVIMFVGEALSFDMFIYCPNQNYPRAIGGNWIERIGAWAYMHE